MDKISQWANDLTKNTESLKNIIRLNEELSTNDIAKILKIASQERLNTIKNATSESQKELNREFAKFATIRTWQILLPLIPFLFAIGFTIWAYVAYQNLSGYQEQKAEWDKKAPKAVIATCTTNGKNPRVCVEVDPEQGTFTNSKGKTLMVLEGY